MRITIFGSTGFIGKALCRALIQRNCQLSLYVRNQKRVPSDIAHNVSLYIGTIDEDDKIRSAVSGANLVVNLITCYESAGNQNELIDININFPEKLAEISWQGGVQQLIHTSTAGIFAHSTESINELSAIDYLSKDTYERTKAMGEGNLVNACNRLGIDLAVLRPTTVYGPEDLRLFKLFDLIRRKKFFYIGSGENYQNYIYIDDVINAYQKTIEYLNQKRIRKDRNVTLLCNIGTEPSIRLRDVFKIIAKQLSVEYEPVRLPASVMVGLTKISETLCSCFHIRSPLYRGRINFFLDSRTYNFKFARDELLFNPSISIVEGVKRTITFYKKHIWQAK